MVVHLVTWDGIPLKGVTVAFTDHESKPSSLMLVSGQSIKLLLKSINDHTLVEPSDLIREASLCRRW